MIVFAPAKVNLGLYLGNNRTDGYHDIVTMMAPVSLYDTIEVTKNNGNDCNLTVKNASFEGNIEDNLVYKAWKLTRDLYGVGGVDITLMKNIPSGAGLGGGSSDATYTLRALNDLFGLGLGVETIMGLAAQLGSDCAFFAQDSAAISSGRGEVITQTAETERVYEELKKKFKIVIVKPNQSVPTSKAYANVKNYSLTKKMVNRPLEEVANEYAERARTLDLKNDFEASVMPQCPQVAELKDWLVKEGGRYVQMSGSGSAVFALAEPNAMRQMQGAVERLSSEKRIFAFCGDLI